MICPQLKNTAQDIKDGIMRAKLQEQSRDECIEDDCKHFRLCWNNNENKDVVESIMEGEQDG